MTIEFKEQWATALESGEYPQGFGWLNRDGEFCCWGVACELLADELDLARGTATLASGAVLTVYGPGRDNALPPTAVLKYLDINHATMERLVSMNDSQQKSFKEIAAWIRGNL
jgi:hypothetical protein